MEKAPMTLLLVEDNIDECNIFEKYVSTKNNVKFIGIRGSDIEGLEYIK